MPLGTGSQQNPSHILIARSTVFSPTETLTTPVVASGIFPRSSASPPWVVEEVPEDAVDEMTLSVDGDDPPSIDIDPTFTGSGNWPGTVKIVVEATVFWAHKEILVFASPFFDAALSGCWSETNNDRPVSMSSVITIQQLPTIPGEASNDVTEETPVTFTSVSESGSESDTDYCTVNVTPPDDREPSEDPKEPIQEMDITDSERDAARVDTLDRLQGIGVPPRKQSSRSKGRAPDGTIILKEERATIFHDFLKFVYPHLECTITWKNVEGLMNISDKLCVPSLQNACLQFLLSHAAGKPIKAMRIAELFNEEELYREASRFVLENLSGWEEELNMLSKESLLKLEKRRNWFLERVLKLGVVSISKEYQCCPTCPDPLNCARILEDKWKQGYSAAVRFGPAQPSMVFRYLRSLEGVSPPLALTHLSCQNHAKLWIATLFDRMFSLGVRGSGVDAPPLGARVAGAAASPGLKRHFLYCSLKPEPSPTKSKQTRP